ncbi:MAG: efflux RND transporter periplasmic adaptor subunit [Candidatus Zixiibacteriota bacterium]|nr:MAG: efflux RND transporter periplasmic adaptor subunit [candidate division Zixibacteria bacterium]
MKKRTKKILLITAAAVVVIVIVISSLGGSNGEGTQVQADLAYIGDISEIVTASGRVQPQTKVDITAEVSAEIIAIYISEGQRVSKGERLLLLDTIQTKSDVAQARFSLDEVTARTQAARSQFERDKREFERQSSLHEQKLSSETEYANAKFTYENSKANYEAMQAQMKTGQAFLEKAEDNLSKTLILAPMDGVITYLSAEVGEIAQAQTSFTQGKTLLTVADLSVFEVEVDVDETEIAMVKDGHSAGIRVDAFPDSVFEGTVVEVGNSAKIANEGNDSYTTSFRVKVRFDETEAVLRPGMSASVDITTSKQEEALLIPYASIVEREFDPDSLKLAADSMEQQEPATSSGEVYAAETDQAGPAEEKADSAADSRYRKKDKIKKSGVFVVKNGLAEFVEVPTGIADDRNVVALSGLNPGDTVISGSFQTLRKLAVGDAVVIDEASREKMEEEG